MLVPRYYSPMVDAICILGGIGLAGIKGRYINVIFCLVFMSFSLNHIFVIKNYYHQPNKQQYRSCAEFIKEHSTKGEDLVSSFAWHYAYFFKGFEKAPERLNPTLDAYVNGLRPDSLNAKSFWYSGIREKNYVLSASSATFLKNTFLIDRRIDAFEANAIHFKKITKQVIPLDLSGFEPIKPTDEGSLLMDGSVNIKFSKVTLEKGSYKLMICGMSLPKIPLNNINAHISLKINDNKVGGCFINSSDSFLQFSIPFYNSQSREVSVELLFDNDFYIQGLDRNLKIQSVAVYKM